MPKNQIILGIVALLVMFGGYGIYKAVTELSKTPETFIVGREFLEHLADGEIEEASALAIEDLQSEEAQEVLAGMVEENQPLFTEDTEIELTGRGFYNDVRYAYGTISSGEASSFIYLEFRDEDGETRVSFMSFDEEDLPDFGSDEEK